MPGQQRGDQRGDCAQEKGDSKYRANSYSPPYVDRIWFWVYYNKVPIYPIFYLLKEDDEGLKFKSVMYALGSWVLGVQQLLGHGESNGR